MDYRFKFSVFMKVKQKKKTADYLDSLGVKENFFFNKT